MEYAELVQAVIDTTERGESVPRVELAIAKATLKFHAADFWMRDLVEVLVGGTQFTNISPRFEISTSQSLPGFRKLKYLQGYDSVAGVGTTLGAYEEISPSSVLDSYGSIYYEKFYLAGDTLTIFSGRNPAAILVGYYAYPTVSAANYNSWIGRDLPFAVIDEACAEIFGSVGDADEAQRRRAMFKDNLQLIRINEIEATAR